MYYIRTILAYIIQRKHKWLQESMHHWLSFPLPQTPQSNIFFQKPETSDKELFSKINPDNVKDFVALKTNKEIDKLTKLPAVYKYNVH